MVNYKVIGEFIKKSREKKGMTQKELAKRLGYENSKFISQIETGKRKIPLKTLSSLSRELNLDSEELIGRLLQWVEIRLREELSKPRK